MIGKLNNLNSKEIETFSVSKNDDDIQYFFLYFSNESKKSKFIRIFKSFKEKNIIEMLLN